jgi:hypothetical protein
VSYLTFRHALLLFALSTFFVSTLLAERPHAQTSSTLGRRANTWAARSSSGLSLAGTWTATEDPKTGAVTGTWTLVDKQGKVTANGGWSAAKEPSGWNGSWRAVATGRSGEYAGTWTATVDPKSTGKLRDLFTKAVEGAISGTFQSGKQSGAWTIQAFT